jgi:hypothetical protein
MPRYYLNVLHGGITELDQVGLEFQNDTEAVPEVIRAISWLRTDEFAADDWTDRTLEILEGGRTVRRLTLEDFGASLVRSSKDTG